MRPGGEGNDGQYRGAGQPGWPSGPPQGPPYGNSPYGGPAGSPPFGPSSTFGRSDPYGPPDPGPDRESERGPSSYGAAPTGAPARGRPGLILLTAFLVELVVVAAVGNTWAIKKVLNFRSDHNDVAGAVVSTPEVFAWRFTPQDHDTIRQYPAQLFGLLTLFVLAALLTLAVVRGAITFGRAFFGIWMAVIVAVLADGIVQRAVEKDFGRYTGLGGKSVGVLFGGNGYETMAGVGLGFVAALVAALVAVVTRRPAVAAPPSQPAAEPDYGPDPDAPPPFFGEPARDPRASDATRSLSMQKVQDAVGDRRDAPPPPSAYGPAEPAPSPASSGYPASEGSSAGTARATEATQAIPVQRDQSDGSGEAAPNSPQDDATVRRSDLPEAPGAVPESQSGPQSGPQSQQPESQQPESQQPESQQPSEPEPTARFPRPPDDEDLGHHPE